METEFPCEQFIQKNLRQTEKQFVLLLLLKRSLSDRKYTIIGRNVIVNGQH